MAVAVCWSCRKVKGKRVCPARGGELICSKCCGTKRRVEIQCPDDCHYLHGADPNWQSQAQQKDEARFIARFLELTEEQIVFLLFVHHVVFSSPRRFANLSDEELREVVGATLKTLETRGKGIVYSHPTSSPHLEPLAQWLGNVLSERSKIETAPNVSDEDLLAVLVALERAIREHAEDDSTREKYLERASNVFRSSLEGAPPLELPDDDGPPPELIVPP